MLLLTSVLAVATTASAAAVTLSSATYSVASSSAPPYYICDGAVCTTLAASSISISSTEPTYVCDGAVCTTLATSSTSISSAKPTYVCDGAVCTTLATSSTSISSAEPTYVCDGAVCTTLAASSTAPITGTTITASLNSLSSKPASTSVSCTTQWNNCPSTGLSDDQCTAQLAACRSRCEQTLNYCEVDYNVTTCVNSYNQCLGTGPLFPYPSSAIVPSSGSVSRTSVTPSGTRTSVSPSGSALSCVGQYNWCATSSKVFTPAQCAVQLSECKSSCKSVRTKCELAPNSNKSTCESRYEDCVGRGPAVNGSSTTLCSATTGSPVAVVTTVVTSFSTWCPEPTTVTYNSQTYTVTSATTLTITNCPCTITIPVSPSGAISTTMPDTSTITVSASATAPVTTTSPSLTPYTGDADKVKGQAAVMLGALALFAL